METLDQRRAISELVAAFGGSLALVNFSSRTGRSQAEIAELIQSDSLLSFSNELGILQIPTWQIHNQEILDGVPEVLKALGVRSALSKHIFFTTFSDYLEGELADELGSNDINPIMALRLGYKSTVLKAIENES